MLYRCESAERERQYGLVLYTYPNPNPKSIHSYIPFYTRLIQVFRCCCCCCWQWRWWWCIFVLYWFVYLFNTCIESSNFIVSTFFFFDSLVILLSFHNTHFIFMFSLQIPIFFPSRALSLFLVLSIPFLSCEAHTHTHTTFLPWYIKFYQVIGLNECRQPELMTIQKLQISVLTLEWLQTVSGFFFFSIFLNVSFLFLSVNSFSVCVWKLNKEQKKIISAREEY